MNALAGLNISIFRFLHGFAGRSEGLDFVIVFFAEYYIFFLFAVVGLAFLHDASRRDKSALLGALELITTIATTRIFVEAARFLYERPRPFRALEGVTSLFIEPTHTFPSGHTIFIFAFGTALYPRHPRIAAFIFCSGLIVGASRVMAGVHYPADILGGAVFGVGIGALVHWWLQRVFRSDVS